MLGILAQSQLTEVRVQHAGLVRIRQVTHVMIVLLGNTSQNLEKQCVCHVDPTVFPQRIARSVCVMLDTNANFLSMLPEPVV